MDIGGVECFIMDMHVMLPKRTESLCCIMYMHAMLLYSMNKGGCRVYD